MSFGLVMWISTLKYARCAARWNLWYLIKRQNSSFLSVSVTMWFLIGGSNWKWYMCILEICVLERSMMPFFVDFGLSQMSELWKCVQRSQNLISFDFKIACLTFTFSVCHSGGSASSCCRTALGWKTPTKTAMLRSWWTWKPNEILTDHIHPKYKCLSNAKTY